MTAFDEPTFYPQPAQIVHKLAVLLDTVAHLVDVEPDETFHEADVREAAALAQNMLELRLAETAPPEPHVLPDEDWSGAPIRFAPDGSPRRR